ncbi:MAG: hypothetical protein MSH22_04160 [Spirochaetia bacterium]|nr:hypothetical protein [Spirochaetia bacterium]
MKIFIKKAIFTILFFATCLYMFGQQNASVAFFGIYSPDADKNMLSMTEDLYFKQLSDMDLSIKDNRSDSFSENYDSKKESLFSECEETFAFFIIIKKNTSEKWECSINLRNIETKKTKSISKEYDSYYKILMDSKTNLKASIKSLFDETEENQTIVKKSVSTKSVTTESIAGTWTGEDAIAKIVIMRGGRGFVVFKNGATMNISVSITAFENNTNTINVKQNGSNNASFFTDLNRKLALESAVTAKPIEWNFLLQNDGTLKGEKSTLIEKNGTAENALIPVTWTKNN